jgi:hypothetical protein
VTSLWRVTGMSSVIVWKEQYFMHFAEHYSAKIATLFPEPFSCKKSSDLNSLTTIEKITFTDFSGFFIPLSRKKNSLYVIFQFLEIMRNHFKIEIVLVFIQILGVSLVFFALQKLRQRPWC